MSVNEGLDNSGAEVPASESDGMYTGGGAGCSIDPGMESEAVLLDVSVSTGGISSFSGNKSSGGGSERRNSSSSCDCPGPLGWGEGISTSPSLSVSVSDPEEYPYWLNRRRGLPCSSAVRVRVWMVLGGGAEGSGIPGELGSNCSGRYDSCETSEVISS